MQIPRLHLFEIHEQAWFPSAIRDGVTDGLYTIWKLMFWKNTLPHLQDLLKHAKGTTSLLHRWAWGWAWGLTPALGPGPRAGGLGRLGLLALGFEA